LQARRVHLYLHQQALETATVGRVLFGIRDHIRGARHAVRHAVRSAFNSGGFCRPLVLLVPFNPCYWLFFASWYPAFVASPSHM
jgi:hypothetical protein